MALTLKYEIEGLGELREQLKRLDDATAGKALRNAAMAAMRIARKDAKKRAPEGPTGNLKRAIKVRSFTGVQGLAAVAGVYVDPRIAPHWHLVEFGTQDRRTKSGKRTGRATPKPFIRPAFDDNRLQIIEKFRSNLAKGIEKRLKLK